MKGIEGFVKLMMEVDELVISAEEGDHTRCEIVKNILREKLKIISKLDEEILGLCDAKEIEVKSSNRWNWSREF